MVFASAPAPMPGWQKRTPWRVPAARTYANYTAGPLGAILLLRFIILLDIFQKYFRIRLINQTMETLKEILSSKRKPKEKVSASAEIILKDHNLFEDLMKILETGTDVEKGNCADIMKHVTAEKPEIAEPYIDDLIKYINYKTPRVKWGVPESIGNVAKKFPEKAEKAIPFLFKNTVENKDNSTVIRWCSAYALSEIAKASRKKELINQIEEAAKKETNNGVRNVYLKAIKEIKRIDPGSKN